jgi:transcriptional regulator GlxA family with amidase domain
MIIFRHTIEVAEDGTPMHRIAVLALPGVIPFDLSIPSETFGRLVLPDGSRAYSVRVCAETTKIEAAPFDLHLRHGLGEIARANTIIIPGTTRPTAPVPAAVRQALQRARARGARIASICVGAFVLAAVGFLDGQRATTHWKAAGEFRRLFPRVDLDPTVLFVDTGQFLTSAGAAAGLDLCLHMVRCDYGQSVAAQAARLAVTPIDRDGGQAQFIESEPPTSSANLAPLLAWTLDNLDKPLCVDTLAQRVRLSPRTFARRFREQTGTTPIQWLLMARVRKAQEILESSALSVEKVAAAAGFESAITFRARFHRTVGLSPTSYRRRFNAAGGALAAAGRSGA